APFDQSDSDVVLRSSTGVNFFAHKVILRMASPFFETMLSLPQSAAASSINSEDFVDGLPCIRMSEDTQTLHRLLTFIYPVSLSMPKTVKESLLLLSAFQKYQLDDRMAVLRRLLASEKSCVIDKFNAVEVFGLAHQHRLVEEALRAARVSLKV
ncbi:hypothetical protein K488DRAFT_34634, partial [Vararia minispora EC-137]